MKSPLASLLAFYALLACASSAWREGFTNNDQLYLVGEGRADSQLPQLQRLAMAREAAILDALSHWPKYCPVKANDEGVIQYRVENQKQRLVECFDHTCRARVVIERNGLREHCDR